MRSLLRLGATALALTALATPALAQDAPAGGTGNGAGPRAAELPLTPGHTVKYSTDEGTWLSLDVSPDGSTIVTDIMGDLYTLPIAGGKATRITEGMAFDMQPRWSPDGKQIVFVSDRDGSDDVWLIDASGKNPRQVTRTDRTAFLSPEWTPDGKFFVVSRNAALFGTSYALWL